MQRRKYALLKQPFELDALGDVSLTNPVLGDVIYYDGSFWINTPYAELVDDRVASLLVAGNNIDLTYNDILGTITIDVEQLSTADLSDAASIAMLNQNETVTGSWTFNANLTLGTDIGIVFDEHASAPGTPASGKVILYAKADGLLYSKDDAGTETVVTGGGGGGGAVATDAIWDAKGDLAVGTGANTASKLTVGADTYVLTADSATATGLKWAAPGASSVPPTDDPKNYAYYFTDFVDASIDGSNAGPCWVSSISGGTISSQLGTNANPGIITVSTSTSSTGSAIAKLGTTTSPTPWVIGTNKIVAEFLLNIPTLPVSGGDDYVAYGGLCGSVSGSAITDAVYFRVTNGGNINLRSRVGAGTDTNSVAQTHGMSGGTWYVLRLEMTSSLCEVFVNGTSKGSINTGITTAGLAPFFGITKTNGTTESTMQVDFVRVASKISGGRASSLFDLTTL